MASNLQKMYRTTMKDHSSSNPYGKSGSAVSPKTDLANIIRDGFTRSTSDRTTQCYSNTLNEPISPTDRVLIGNSKKNATEFGEISPRSGFIDRDVQVQMNDDSIDSYETLLQLYSNRLSEETIGQFYEICHGDLQWTRTQLDEYLRHPPVPSSIPTLRQLSLNSLNRWNEQIKASDSSFESISIGHLLQDLNDEEIHDEFLSDETDSQPSSLEFNDQTEMIIPSTLIFSLQKSFGEIPNLNALLSSSTTLTLPLDQQLSMELHQALQRFLGLTTPTSNKSKKPTKDQRKAPQQQQQQQWLLPSKSKSSAPSLKEIMNEELNYLSTQKSTQKRSLDFASQHKLRELEREFPSFNSEILSDLLIENESDLDLTRVCIHSMLDADAPIAPVTKPVSPARSSTTTTSKSPSTFDATSYQRHRKHAQDCAVKRKDFYQKASQANRHGMNGVASHYLNQAHQETLRMKEANRLAAEQLAEKRLNEFRQTRRLDLHEFYSDEALNLFKRVEEEFFDGNRRTTPVSLEVITGYGKGSVYGGGSGKIRSVIISYLKQKKYKYTEPNKGALLVQFGNTR